MEICRFCLESDHVEKLISPCNCSGSQKFVHLECITRWQETKLKKVFSYPEIYDFTDVRTCNVCKGQFDIKIAPKYWKLANLASPLFKFTLKYWYSFLLGLIILALFSGVLLIPFALNTISIVVGFYIFCKIQGIRPTIFANESGLRLGLIRIGDPVDFIRPGILIKATEKISSGIFAGSIILITAYSVEEGAVGFIINKRISKF